MERSRSSVARVSQRKPRPEADAILTAQVGRAAVPAPRAQRLDSVDLYRGIIMIIMLLDHVRDCVHREGMSGDPLNVATTTPLLYFTRWVTHLCAPAFVLLAGAS